MAFKFSSTTSALILGLALSLTPALAKQGGNGNGNSGGNGNGKSGSANASSTEGTSSTKVAKVEKATKLNHGAIASQLGALNAAHASAKAFANALPNSRLGKIKAYYFANQFAVTAAITAGETDADVLRGTFDLSGPTSVLESFEALQADPTNPALQEAYANAVTGAALTTEQVTAVESAYTAWKSAVDADALAASAAADAQVALDAAANKLPVSPDARIALDALLVGKIE